MIRRHKRTYFTVLSAFTIVVMFLGVFQLLQPESDAHDKCKSQRAAVANAQKAVTRAQSTYNSARQSLTSAKRSLANAKAALAACEAQHRRDHEDPG